MGIYYAIYQIAFHLISSSRRRGYCDCPVNYLVICHNMFRFYHIYKKKGEGIRLIDTRINYIQGIKVMFIEQQEE